MKLIERLLLLIIVLLSLNACNRNYYRTISSNDFVVNNWYQFDDYRFKGSLSNGLPSGHGVVEYNNGATVSGVFENGVLTDPNSKFILPRIGTIEGRVVRGKLISGNIQYQNGDMYTGRIQGFKPDGNGILIKSNNDVFEGSFESGELKNGVFYDAKTQSTFQGSFQNWKPDGDVVEIKPDGKAVSHIYANGVNKTATLLDAKAKEIIRNKNQSEIKQIDTDINKNDQQKESRTISYKAEKEKIEKEGGEMYKRCKCAIGLELCLGVYNSSTQNDYSYDLYYKEFDLPAPYGPIYGRIYSVAVPKGSSKAQIKQAFLNKIQFITECVEWNKDRDNYERMYKNKLENLVASHENFLRNIQNEQKRLKDQREQAQRRQENEQQARYKAEVDKIKREMQERAEKAARQRKDYCTKNPDCCLSAATIARLKESKKYSPCTTNQ